MSDDWFHEEARVAAPEADDVAVPDLTYTVADPAGVVAVTAGLDGSTEFVSMSPRIADLSESELAEEVMAVAEAARMKALAAQYDIVGMLLAVGGQGDDAVREVLARMQLPSPDEAAEAQSRFAARYYGG